MMLPLSCLQLHVFNASGHLLGWSFGGRLGLLRFFCIRRLGGDDGMHVSPFYARGLLDYADIGHAPKNILDDPEAYVTVDYFPPAEHDNNLDFVAAAKEAKDVLNLKIEVVVIGSGPEFDLLDNNIFLFRAGGVLPLGFHELVFAIVCNPADRRIGGGGNFHKIQTLVSSNPNCFGGA
jgi:hypothetical protein